MTIYRVVGIILLQLGRAAGGISGFDVPDGRPRLEVRVFRR